jgi:hypothetical protein
MSELHQKSRDVLHERRRPAHENPGILRRRKTCLRKQRAIDSPTMARPPGGLAAGQRMEHTHVAIAPRRGVELRAIDDIVHASACGRPAARGDAASPSRGETPSTDREQ